MSEVSEDAEETSYLETLIGISVFLCVTLVPIGWIAFQAFQSSLLHGILYIVGVLMMIGYFWTKF